MLVNGLPLIKVRIKIGFTESGAKQMEGRLTWLNVFYHMKQKQVQEEVD